MDSEDLRSWLHGLIIAWRAAYDATLPVYYENADMPDEASMGLVWLDVRTRYTDGQDTTIGPNSRGRDFGTLSVMVFYREGEGTQKPDEIIDSLRTYLRANRRSGSARLKFPTRTGPTNFLGWHKTGLLIPFFNDIA